MENGSEVHETVYRAGILSHGSRWAYWPTSTGVSAAASGTNRQVDLRRAPRVRCARHRAGRS